MTLQLNASELDTLRNVTGWFLPALDGYPSLADADPDERVLALVLSQMTPLSEAITAALAAVPGDAVDAHMTELGGCDEDGFILLRTLCLGWYLTCRPVWAALGYTGRAPTPISPGDADYDLRDGILDAVRERGKIFRGA
jgi:hypothetical protein